MQLLQLSSGCESEIVRNMSVTDLLRPNIRKLVPYRCARDDYKVGILLDANENTSVTAVSDLSEAEKRLDLNRYPDPHLVDVKQLLCNLRNAEAAKSRLPASLAPQNICLGVGSDESIDALQRALCRPGTDKILICPPTYGMYKVSADINDLSVVSVPLDENFDLQTDKIIEKLQADPTIKMALACSPGNPTGKLLKMDDILKITRAWTGGVVVVDEAYVDFSGPSCATLVTENERLAVLQTLSKSFGLAGLRCGVTFAHENLAIALNSMKAPYNISSITAELARRALSPASIKIMRDGVAQIVAERARMVAELPKIDGLGKIVGGLDANFVMVQVLDKARGVPSNEHALKIYKLLAETKQVVVRYRGNELNCVGCLRISIGTKDENDTVIQVLKEALSQ